MPRNLFVPLAAVPTNVPLSSVTMGQVLSDEGEAKTVAVTTQTETSSAWRKTMSARRRVGKAQERPRGSNMRRKADYKLGSLLRSPNH